MKAEKIEDAHHFKRELNIDAGLDDLESKSVHEAYQSFINENYDLKKEKTHMDYILNKSTAQ